jgi:hypothetical protein
MSRTLRFGYVLLVAILIGLVDRCTAEAASVLEAGSVVTYTDAAGRDWCATVHGFAPGPSADPWAWLTINADPRRVVRAEVASLRLGCSS